MRRPVTYNELDTLMTSPRDNQDKLRALTGLIERHGPRDQVPLSDLLTQRALVWQDLERWDEAVEDCQRAVAEPDGGWDARPFLAAALILAGRPEAGDYAKALLREGLDEAGEYEIVAGAFLERQDVKSAHRWLTVAVNRAVDDRLRGNIPEIVKRRAQVRAVLGLPPDDLEDLGGQVAQAWIDAEYDQAGFFYDEEWGPEEEWSEHEDEWPGFTWRTNPLLDHERRHVPPTHHRSGGAA
ncbi:MAG: hypothetical protein ACTHMZ_15490 [Actinomycetes bacterium]